MFLARPFGEPAHEVIDPTDAQGVVWLDLIEPNSDQLERANRIAGMKIPTRDQLDEIESSSRHYKRGDIVYLSMPMVDRNDLEDVTALPIGIVLAPDKIITIRYADYNAFDIVGRDIAEWKKDEPRPSAPEILMILLEAIVNRIADVIEALGRDLDVISRKVFAADQPRKRARTAEMLRETLRRLGHSGDLTSYIRDSLLALDRTGHFLGDNTEYMMPAPLSARMKIVARDVLSLNDASAQTWNKIQFLLDATLGFISIEQNDGMKLLTVVSFVGITPTLIAGVYGMNFKTMPELDWHYGYYYCLGLMMLSILVPLVIFWRRGWFGAR
ncbi:magnesium transporter CorA family protein [Brytella acorum]|uniref:Magnesium transporter CorA family protein n=1 Tax=Brytella acorum TaxID=2959299 RepID=A0AA35UWQ9_9PROT|nr:magnesium transporter CorA family protein [Brytella acorum]MDF3625046.1 magnesium transporter CorA family protein [Brytella acorum]CAI9121075.1 magnesium transporter CorA family protein [Brytella acorum]